MTKSNEVKPTGVSKSNGVYNDRGSLARCEPYSDLYDTIRAPLSTHHPKGRVQPLPTFEDVPTETLQQKLKREATERFRANNFMVPGVKLRTVAGLLKYTFMCIMVPLYLLFFRFPKWIFKTGIPKTAGAINHGFEKISVFLAKFFGFIIEKALSFRWSGKKFNIDVKGRKFGELIKELKELLMNSMRNAAAGIGNAFKKLFYYPVNLVKNVFAKIHAAVEWIQKGLKKIGELIANQFRKVKQVVVKIKTAFVNILKGIKKIVYAIAIPIANWINPKALYIANLLNRVALWASAKLERYFKAALAKISPPVLFFLRIFKRMGNWVVSKIEPRAHSLAAWMNKKSKALADAMRIVKFYAKKPGREFVPMAKKAGALINRICTATYRSLISGFKGTGNAMVEILRSLVHLMPHWINRWLIPTLEFIASSCVSLCRLLKRSVIAFGKKIKAFAFAITAVISKLQLVMNKMEHALQALFLVLKPIPVKLYAPLSGISRFAAKAMGHLGYSLRVGMAWTTVLLQYGMQLVRDTTEKKA